MNGASMKTWWRPLIVLSVLVGAGIVLTTASWAQRDESRDTDSATKALFEKRADKQDKADGKNAVVRAGTYESQQVFTSSKFGEKLTKDFEGLQRDMQAAQQEGDQQKMAQVQMRAQQMQQRVVATFQQNVKKVMPDVAKEAKVQIIAPEIVYAADDVETQDLTRAVVKHLDDLPDEASQLPTEPRTLELTPPQEP